MGNDENKKAKRRHIYDELNKSIDSFTSCDDYYCDDNTKRKRSNLKSKNKYRTKYKIKNHKKFSKDEQLNNKLIESSLILSDFLINNIINKNEGQRPLPDTNLVNSMLLFPELFINEGFQIENQREYCDQLLFNGINNYKKEYKEFELNKKKEDISYDYYTNNPVSTKKIFINETHNINLENEINKNENNDQYIKINDDIKNNLDEESQNENMENNNINDHGIDNDNFLYQPKIIKKTSKSPIYKKSHQINKNKYKINKEDFYSNHMKNNNIINDNIKGIKSYDEDEKNKNKIINNCSKDDNKKTKTNTININKGNYIRKKKFINKKEQKNDLYDNISNLSNNKKDYNSYRNSNKSNNKKNNLDKAEKAKMKVKNNINSNIKQKLRGISDEKNINKRNNTFDFINEDHSYDKFDLIKKKKKEISNLNNIERNSSFDIINNNKSHWRNNKIEIERSSNFNIKSKDKSNTKNKNNRYNNAFTDNNNNNYYNSNIEFKSEYKKSGIYLHENNNDDFDEIKDIAKSSLKDYINKEADIIKHNPNYINSKMNRNKIDKSNEEFDMNRRKEDRISNTNNISNKNRYKNSYFDNNNTHFNDNISNIYSNNINDTIGNSIKSKINKLKNYNDSNQQTIIKIDLRSALSTLKSKNKNNSNL